MVALVWKDINLNGKFDSIEMIFSENISWIDFSEFSVTQLASGASYALSWTAIWRYSYFLFLNESSQTYDTDVSALVSYNGNSVVDAAWNGCDTFFK